MATTKITSQVLDLNAGRADYSLTSTNTVTYVGASGGNQYVFNGAYGTYGVVNGTYVLSSVSSSHPIAIINNGKTSLISYTGAVNEGTGTGPDGNTYTFYSGNVTITVSGNFDTVSYYCLNHGYMGGKDNLIYIDSVGESGLKMPSGTTSNQPTGASGIIRNNTDESNGGSSSCMEYYNGSNWKVMVNCTTNVLDILDDGSCIATYTFDGNVNDLSGNYNGTATSISYLAGKYGQAADFNGSSSKVELPSALSDGSTTVANCISFWFNVGAEVTPSTPSNEIMNFAQSSSNFGKIALGATTGNFSGETFSVTSDVVDQYTYMTSNIPAGWNHAVVQWNSSNTKWDIYINGNAQSTNTWGTNQQGNWALKFGNRSSFYYTGQLDQVRIFNKSLSASEVTTVYNEVAC